MASEKRRLSRDALDASRKSAKAVFGWAMTMLCGVGLGGCNPKLDTTAAKSDPSPSVSVDAVVAPGDASIEASLRDADARAMSSALSTTILAADAGAGACKLLRPALMQTYGGPAALRLTRIGAGEITELIFNDAGRPLFSGVSPTWNGHALREVPMPPKTTLPGCAVARDVVYCPDANGAIHRTHGGGEGDTIVAQGRAGTPIAAATIGNGQVVLAYIEEGATSEGQVRQARAILDNGPAVPLSEEGSGATSVELATRGADVVAMTIDARVALTPMHVRILRVRGGNLEMGRDAVVFVGGSGERRTAGTLALTPEGSAFAMVAVSDSAESFGMATVRLSDPPTEDNPVVWSLYPSGLDPASIAASKGISPVRVARVRPTGPEVDASHVLEVGELASGGEFLPKCILSEAAYIKDVELEIDRQGSMWIFWRDTRGSHLERRALP